MASSAQQNIFISYSREDVAFARDLRERLIALGHLPWMDLFDIPAGARWPTEIDKALHASDAIIGVMSPASFQSDNVMNEWDWAIANDRRLILLMAESCEVPFHYVSINYIDLTTDLTAGFTALAEALNTPDTASMLETDKVVVDSTPAMFGRHRELGLLRETLDQSMHGNGRLVLVGGEAGIGKTTLVNAIADEASGHGAMVLRGGCYDLTTTPPYGPWVELFANYSTVSNGLPLLPDPLRVGGGMGDIGSQAELISLAHQFLTNVAAVRPLVLVLEDLHWSDSASMELLRYIGRFVADLRLLLVTTYRDDELTRRHPLFQLLPLLVRESDAIRIDLRRWSTETTRELVINRYSINQDDAVQLADFLQHHAAGNPFFTEELLLDFEFEQILYPGSDDRWQLGDLSNFTVPPMIRQVVERRLSSLEDQYRGLLNVAAVIGADIPLDLWLNVTDVSEEAIAAASEAAMDIHVLQHLPDHSGFQFTHALVRETLYEELNLVQRWQLHRRVGETLATSAPERASQIAHHFIEAVDERAYEWLLAAADQAETSWVWDTAVERVESALSLLTENHPRRQDRGWLFFRLGSLLRWSDPLRGIDYLQAAASDASMTGDSDLEALAMLNAGLVRCFGGNYRRGIKDMERVLARTGKMETPPPQAAGPMTQIHGTAMLSGRGEAVYFNWLTNVGRYDDALRLHTILIERLSKTSNELNMREETSLGYGRVLAGKGYVGEAQAAFEATRVRGDDPVQRANVFLSELVWLILPYRTDHIERRQMLVREYHRAQRQTGTATSRPDPDLEMNPCMFIDGEWDTGRIQNSQVVHENRNGWEVDHWRTVLAEISYHQGNWELTREMARHFFPAGTETEPGDAIFLAAIATFRIMVEMALDEDDLETARQWLDTYESWLDWSGTVIGRADLERLRARISLASDDIRAAWRSGEQALALASDPRKPQVLIATHRFLGKLATFEKNYDEAEQHLDQSLALADACAAPFERALTLLEIGNLRSATGGHDDARRLLTEIREICEPLGAKPTLERVAALEAKLDALNA